MTALVPELVNMASSPAISTADLLRRALVVARRLDVPDLVHWIQSEMNGYAADAKVEDYRLLYGSLMAYNAVRGEDIPIVFNDDETSVFLRRHIERQSIPVLEQVLEGSGQLVTHFSPALERQLQSSYSVGSWMRPKRVFSKAQVQGIVEIVRNRILEWALDLEARGIIGEGMSFTQQERLAVQQHYHFSNVIGSQIQVDSSGASQFQVNPGGIDVASLNGLITALSAVVDGLQGETAAELRAEVATLKAQAESPKPKWAVIKASARSIQAVAEGAAGNILAGLAQPHMATLLGLAVVSA